LNSYIPADVALQDILNLRAYALSAHLLDLITETLTIVMLPRKYDAKTKT